MTRRRFFGWLGALIAAPKAAAAAVTRPPQLQRHPDISVPYCAVVDGQAVDGMAVVTVTSQRESEWTMRIYLDCHDPQVQRALRR